MTRPHLALIAAVASNGVIGRGGAMPWRLSTDMKRFRRITMGKPVVVGRRTFEGFGKPLDGRLNIVVSRRGGALPEGVVGVATLDAALKLAREKAEAAGGDEVMVIGGGEIYAATIGMADRLYVTHVDAALEGDVHFPRIDPAVWREVASESVPAGERDSFATTFTTYERRTAG